MRTRSQSTRKTQAPPDPVLAARVPAELAAAFERMALSEDRTVSQELRRAIRAHVANNAPSPD